MNQKPMTAEVLLLSCHDMQWQLKLDLYLRQGFDVDLIGFDGHDASYCQIMSAQHNRYFDVEPEKNIARFRTTT